MAAEVLPKIPVFIFNQIITPVSEDVFYFSFILQIPSPIFEDILSFFNFIKFTNPNPNPNPSSQHSSLMHANTHINTTANTPTTIVPPSLAELYPIN